ncbi:MAG: response regulator [Deltaproteobacteria bacterium]|nr:response regulator [Deltaproteobacteria bacterium]
MAGENILVIDDCRTVRELMGDILVDAGYECNLAYDGMTGLDMAQASPPDLVLLDFIMPKMNGFQFMQSFRRVENHRDIPVVLVSVKADSMGEKFMRATGAIDALTKPFTTDGLLTIVQHAIRVSKATASTAPPKTTRPYLSPDTFTPEKVPDIIAESKQAMTRIRGKLSERIAEALKQAGDSPVDDTIEEALSDSLILELMDDFKTLDPTAGVAAFAGSTEAITAGEVMQLLLLNMAKGTFELQGPEDMKALIYFAQGRVALARLKGGPDEFLLGRYLLKEDMITSEELRRILDGKEDKRPIGEKLIMMGYISRDDLDMALTRQTTEVLYEILRWQSSHYRLLPGRIPEDAEKLNLSIPVGEMLMEGLRRVDEWRLIESKIPDFDLVPIKTAAGLEAVGPDTTLAAEEARVLDFVNGTNTIREIIRETRLGSFEVCKILHQMLTMKVIRRVE